MQRALEIILVSRDLHACCVCQRVPWLMGERYQQRSMSVAPGASTQDMDHPPSFDIDIDIGAGWDVTTETDIHRVTASSGISREFSLKEETKQGDIDVSTCYYLGTVDRSPQVFG